MDVPEPRGVTGAHESGSPLAIRLACFGLALLIFLLDAATPLDAAVEPLYVVVVVISIALPRKKDTWIIGLACSSLVLVGHFLNWENTSDAPLATRAVSVFVIWSTVLLAVRHKGAEQMFRLAVEGSPSAKILLDDGGRIVLVNAPASRLFGYEREELLGESIEKLVPERHRERHPALRRDFVASPEIRPMGAGRNLFGRRKDGREVPIEIGLNPIRNEGKLYVLSTIFDITERKLAQEALTARNEELRTILYAISHDLREPLRAVESFSDLITERYAPALDAKGQDYLNRVTRGARRMRRMLDDLSALARARQDALSREHLLMTDIVEEALRRLDDKIEQVAAMVSVAGESSLYVNRTWAVHAVTNLLDNALKFARAGISPEIEIAAYEGGLGKGPGIVVRDRGPGISSENTERVFELFQRASGSEIDGTGAGLAIVRTVAERHGGVAGVSARAGGGSEFFLTFGPLTDHGGDSHCE
ncbi:MAG TPA: PAS domain S-box protein [Vicinamibacteria bacterium]|nr:PAS domain S-box protein [Vicinamibacteria bacterium]